MTTGRQRLSEVADACVFAELDHRLGRHDATPNDLCPSCRPDSVSFTAARDEPATGGEWDYAGLKEPSNPLVGDVWHEPGSGLWMWCRFDEVCEEWVNAMDTTKVRPGNVRMIVSLGSSIQYNAAVKMITTSKILDEVMLRSTAMGVRPEKMVLDFNEAALEHQMHKEDMVAVTSTWTETFETAAGVQFTTTVAARKRPSFAMRVDS